MNQHWLLLRYINLTVNDSVLNKTFLHLRSLSVTNIINNNTIFSWHSYNRSNDLFLWKGSYYLSRNLWGILINNLLNNSALLELNLWLRLGLNLLVDNNWCGLDFTCCEETTLSILTETGCRSPNSLILILLSYSLNCRLFSSESSVVISFSELNNITNGITIQITWTVRLLLFKTSHHKFRIMVSNSSLQSIVSIFPVLG